jgi:hypothetical protein
MLPVRCVADPVPVPFYHMTDMPLLSCLTLVMMATHLLDVPVMFLDALLKTLQEQLMLSALINSPVMSAK